MKETDEFSILKEFFQDLGSQFHDSSGLIIGPGDDAGLFSEPNQELIFSTDVSVSGVHFLENLEPNKIAFGSCVVAASDIAACGGSLKWISISLVLATQDKSWIEDFAKGIIEFVNTYKVPVLGGDLAKGKECSISVGVCGSINKDNFMSRSGAKLNDDIYVTGSLGDACLGLNFLKENKSLSESEVKYTNKYLKPKIEFEFAKELSLIANSCIDLSDGLLGDLNHICEKSNLGATLFLEKIPFSGDHERALTWGDDYELCFSLPSSKEKNLDSLASKYSLKVTKLGTMKAGHKVTILDNEKEIHFNQSGYNHFNE